MVLHSVTLWTGAWESGSGWGLTTIIIYNPLSKLCGQGPGRVGVASDWGLTTIIIYNPLSNFVGRGLGEWEWLGPGSTKIITLCNTPKNLPTLLTNFGFGSLPLSHSLNYPPFLSSVPLSHALTHGGLHSGLRPRAPTSIEGFWFFSTFISRM